MVVGLLEESRLAVKTTWAPSRRCTNQQRKVVSCESWTLQWSTVMNMSDGWSQTAMNNMTASLLVVSILLIPVPGSAQEPSPTDDSSVRIRYQHPIPFAPRKYLCRKAKSAIDVDGRLEESEWEGHPWSADFVDIQGEIKPLPPLQTRVKMTWDDDFFYIAADLKEPHVWGKLENRDDIIFHDDDFEVFIDPDADGHQYFEFEVNVKNTVWDLLMLHPYGIDSRRNYVMNWNVESIRTAVNIRGTLNDPTDEDDGWSVEMAIPWTTFEDLQPKDGRPASGDVWRIDFSRVDWAVETKDGRYEKITDDQGKNLPADNWVWSPTGFINMHKPELWGYVQFVEADSEVDQVTLDQDEEQIRWGMWQLYYQVREAAARREWTIDDLTIPDVKTDSETFAPEIHRTPHQFEIINKMNHGGALVLDGTGRIYRDSGE